MPKSFMIPMPFLIKDFIKVELYLNHEILIKIRRMKKYASWFKKSTNIKISILNCNQLERSKLKCMCG